MNEFDNLIELNKEYDELITYFNKIDNLELKNKKNEFLHNKVIFFDLDHYNHTKELREISYNFYKFEMFITYSGEINLRCEFNFITGNTLELTFDEVFGTMVYFYLTGIIHTYEYQPLSISDHKLTGGLKVRNIKLDENLLNDKQERLIDLTLNQFKLSKKFKINLDRLIEIKKIMKDEKDNI